MTKTTGPTDNSLSRRNMLQCMSWAGTGALFSLSGGVAASKTLETALGMPKNQATSGALSFVQISDTHIGFSKAANPDPLGTLRETIVKVKALPQQPDFVLHTGDITHLATPQQFDDAQMLLSQLNMPIYFVPGEHDIVDGTDPRAYLERFGKDSIGEGWYSFDAGGAHFIALVNSIYLGERGMGTLGTEQLAWLSKDLASLPDSTPIILFAHFPLWALYPDWGWGTQDAQQAMTMLARFGSVTALNGHIHQVQQRVEGHVQFHTARSTAFPQPAPGNGPGPGPLLLPPQKLRSTIGLTRLSWQQSKGPIAIIDEQLS